MKSEKDSSEPSCPSCGFAAHSSATLQMSSAQLSPRKTTENLLKLHQGNFCTVITRHVCWKSSRFSKMMSANSILKATARFVTGAAMATRSRHETTMQGDASFFWSRRASYQSLELAKQSQVGFPTYHEEISSVLQCSPRALQAKWQS